MDEPVNTTLGASETGDAAYFLGDHKIAVGEAIVGGRQVVVRIWDYSDEPLTYVFVPPVPSEEPAPVSSIPCAPFVQ